MGDVIQLPQNHGDARMQAATALREFAAKLALPRYPIPDPQSEEGPHGKRSA
jgi:hypothetical protein